MCQDLYDSEEAEDEELDVEDQMGIQGEGECEAGDEAKGFEAEFAACAEHVAYILADAMIDAPKVHNPSLLVGNKNEQLSKEPMDVVELTWRKMAGISVGQASDKS